MDPFLAAAEAAAWLRERLDHDAVDSGVVLGSGWGPLVEGWGEPLARCRTAEVPGFVAPVAEGHRGEVLLYDVGGRRVLVLSGRTHLYEGHGVRPVVHGVRTLGALGAERLVLTNANGSLRYDAWEIGRPLLVRDHLNLTGTSPVEGARFVDLTDAWSPRLRARARSLDPTLAEATYAQLRGPHYNTPAEADWLRTLGADVVGMSTVPEAIAAREVGLELLGLSVVTAIEGGRDAPASSGAGTGIDPSEVVAAAERTARSMSAIVAALV